MYVRKVFSHCLHSKDLAPSEFQPFGPHEYHFAWTKFDNDDRLILKVKTWLEKLDVKILRWAVLSCCHGEENWSICSAITLINRQMKREFTVYVSLNLLKNFKSYGPAYLISGTALVQTLQRSFLCSLNIFDQHCCFSLSDNHDKCAWLHDLIDRPHPYDKYWGLRKATLRYSKNFVLHTHTHTQKHAFFEDWACRQRPLHQNKFFSFSEKKHYFTVKVATIFPVARCLPPKFWFPALCILQPSENCCSKWFPMSLGSYSMLQWQHVHSQQPWP